MVVLTNSVIVSSDVVIMLMMLGMMMMDGIGSVGSAMVFEVMKSLEEGVAVGISVEVTVMVRVEVEETDRKFEGGSEDNFVCPGGCAMIVLWSYPQSGVAHVRLRSTRSRMCLSTLREDSNLTSGICSKATNY
jgi:hypothetical protein